jgi:hypothetical protein
MKGPSPLNNTPDDFDKNLTRKQHDFLETKYSKECNLGYLDEYLYCLINLFYFRCCVRLFIFVSFFPGRQIDKKAAQLHAFISLQAMLGKQQGSFVCIPSTYK